jgi:hypothetical protein
MARLYMSFMARKQPTKSELLKMAERLLEIRKNHAARMRRWRAKRADAAASKKG